MAVFPELASPYIYNRILVQIVDTAIELKGEPSVHYHTKTQATFLPINIFIFITSILIAFAEQTTSRFAEQRSNAIHLQSHTCTNSGYGHRIKRRTNPPCIIIQRPLPAVYKSLKPPSSRSTSSSSSLASSSPSPSKPLAVLPSRELIPVLLRAAR
jgi:hypothetical protein